MAIDVNFNKEYYDKRTYEKTIDTTFTQLGVKTIQEQLDEQPSVQEFFSLYNDLFYQIPELGDTNSHEFLVKTSGDYIAFDENNELIEALQNEIASLREELLATQQELANQSTQT
jgi:transcription initiation factor IIE alpha subunit